MVRLKTGKDYICLTCGTVVYRSAADMRKNRTGKIYCSKECSKTMKLTNPKKYARSQAEYAEESGRLLKKLNCEKCGGVDNIQKHHPDYTKPLEVVWLCRYCHDVETKPARVREVERRRKYFHPCGCGKKAVVRSMCKTCYSKWIRLKIATKHCVVPGCMKNQYSRDLCLSCYKNRQNLSEYVRPLVKRGTKQKNSYNYLNNEV